MRLGLVWRVRLENETLIFLDTICGAYMRVNEPVDFVGPSFVKTRTDFKR